MEQQILTLIRDGHRGRALELMARAWSGPIGRFCTALTGSGSEGEELMQDTFMEAFNALETYRSEASLRSWLFGIARNLCASHLRLRDRRRGLFERFFRSPDTFSDATEKPLEKQEELDELDRALLGLKPALREAVLLHYQSHFSMQEIADMLHISPANARKRVSLGVQALREALRPELMKPDKPAGGYDNDKNQSSVSDYQGPRVLKA